jgi:hypothetical protein
MPAASFQIYSKKNIKKLCYVVKGAICMVFLDKGTAQKEPIICVIRTSAHAPV